MALIRDALSALPARPALVIAPLLVVAVLSLYYRDRYQQCHGIQQDRQALIERLRSLPGPPARVRLTELTGFAWEKARIVATVEPGMLEIDCPLGWNWPSGERDSLVAAGKLSAIVFGRGGDIVRYLEWDNERLELRGAAGELTPQSAVFDLVADSSGKLILSGAEPAKD